jgi:hypothetical protein
MARNYDQHEETSYVRAPIAPTTGQITREVSNIDRQTEENIVQIGRRTQTEVFAARCRAYAQKIGVDEFSQSAQHTSEVAQSVHGILYEKEVTGYCRQSLQMLSEDLHALEDGLAQRLHETVQRSYTASKPTWYGR